MNALNQTLCSNPLFAQRLKLAAADDWYIGQSEVQGQGVFAGRDYEKGEVIDVAMTADGEDEFGAKIWNLTTLARYCNHQHDKNVIIQKADNSFNLVAAKPIKQDDELFADYRQVTKACGPHSRMLWAGKDVPNTDLEDYVEKQAKEIKLYHSCCGKPSGECQGCPGNMQLVEEKDRKPVDEEA